LVYVYWSENIVKYWGMPELARQGIVDVGDFNMDSNSVILKGNWEFYYNKWIITDDYVGEPDGIIHVNDMWTGKVFNGEKLPRSGYASYKCYVRNAKIGTRFTLTIGLSTCAYRIYANGELVSQSGTVSIDPDKTFISPRPSLVHMYTVQSNEDVEIVVELSANNYGGLTYWPLLSSEYQYMTVFNNNLWYGNITPFVFLGVFLSLWLITIILNYLNVSSTHNSSIMIFYVTLLLHYLTTYDMAEKIDKLIPALDFRYFHIFAYITGLTLVIAVLYIINRYKVINISKKSFVLFGAINVLVMIAYFLLSGYMTRYYVFLIKVITLLYMIYKLCYASARRVHYANTYLIIMVLLFTMLILEAIDNNGLFLVGAIGNYSIFCAVMIIATLMIYIRQIKERIDESHQALVLAEEIKEVKNQALKAQIKPHFIFNTMTSIQDIYHRSLEEGDRALSRFSKHLRLNVDSGYKDMVSFQDELNNIQNYFELENLRRGGKLSLLYDIDYVDFDIPILSLQPLIENAVKYGKTDEKEDGYIQIKSYEEEESIIVEVNDNGSGFDISEIKENSTGLKNVTQRLGFSLNANVEIISKKGEGTTVKIIIPKVSK
jgi:sensor histidine kinase YesM